MIKSAKFIKFAYKFYVYADSAVETTHVGYIVRPPSCSHVWGLESVVKHTDPASLAGYQWLLQSVVPERTTLATQEGYSVGFIVFLIVL